MTSKTTPAGELQLRRNEAVVRCNAGHIYRSIWIPFASLKAARLGWNLRFQHCPVGHHWSLTRKVDPATLKNDERAQAIANHDSGWW